MGDEVDPLLGLPAPLSPSRWYVLTMFTALTTQQCLFWFTFSSVPDAIKTYYGPDMDDHVLDQLLNWGPIIFIPVLPFVPWLLTQRNGLRHSMLLTAGLCLAGCLVRIIPCFLSEEKRWQRASWTCLHIGQA